MMRRVLWGIVIFVVLVGGAFAVFRDPGRIHLYSANGSILAETQAEAWCSGISFWDTDGRGDAPRAAQCRIDVAALDADGSPPLGTEVNRSKVQFWFCDGIKVAGFEGSTYADCQVPLTELKLWPTIAGQLEGFWTKTYPYPLDVFGGSKEPEDERGQDRPGFER